MSPHGFSAVGRGRGYRPEQVDRYVTAVSEVRDAAWERAARLTVLVNEMTAEAERLREVVAQLGPQTYETLGDRARLILLTVEQETADLRGQARAVADRTRESAEAAARAIRDAAREEADRVRAEAQEWERQALEAAQEIVHQLRVASRQDAKEWRGAALAELRQARERSAAVLAEQERELNERWEAVSREVAGQEAAMDTRIAELEEYARMRLADAERAHATAGDAARYQQEEAEARGAELIAQARIRQERVERDTERALREHTARRDELKSHLDHVRNSLAALTGRPPTPDPELAAVPDPDNEETVVVERPTAPPTGRVPGPAKRGPSGE
ncbi:cellulose-binding protein [Streptomyces sp. SAJ15]|uniref:cellulose-binding protein n=1 Tax=Streptomyces sp. SAJ15 TaxID=2011095 RepID=UPI0028CB8574|nr:cellulose-binding protein [Streptomyces sp. SAJ15]